MKKLLIAALMLVSLSCAAQKAKKDTNGNYVQVKKDTVADLPTGRYFINSKGDKFPLYLSKGGKLYYWKVSGTTGKAYKVTLTVVQ